LWGMGYGGVENVVILVVEQGFDALYERVCFSHSWTFCPRVIQSNEVTS